MRTNLSSQIVLYQVPQKYLSRLQNAELLPFFGKFCKTIDISRILCYNILVCLYGYSVKKRGNTMKKSAKITSLLLSLLFCGAIGMTACDKPSKEDSVSQSLEDTSSESAAYVPEQT